MSIPVQCTRCRNKHLESDRVSKRVDNLMSELVCPRCSCRSYFDLRHQVAWCWSSGLIEIGDALPGDAESGGGPIMIATGPKAFLRGVLGVVARHGYGESAGLLLVPGVPEAESMRAKADALEAWLEWCSPRSRDGVVFNRAAPPAGDAARRAEEASHV